MKWFVYKINIPSNIGSEENPVMKDCLYDKSLPYSAEAEEIAKQEAYNGEYHIKDDGEPEPIAPATDAPTWDELAAALREGVNDV